MSEETPPKKGVYGFWLFAVFMSASAISVYALWTQTSLDAEMTVALARSISSSRSSSSSNTVCTEERCTHTGTGVLMQRKKGSGLGSVAEKRMKAAGKTVPKNYKPSVTFTKPLEGKERLPIGVYLGAPNVGNREYLLKVIEALAATPHPAIVFDVKGSNVYFDSTAPMAKELDLIRAKYSLTEIVALAHEHGIYTIGRFISAKDGIFSSKVPEVQIRHPKSNVSVGNVWVDPGHPTTLQYNEEIIRDLVRAGIDEINLDYIRYPTEYAMSQIGLTGREKSDKLEKFLHMVRRVINEEKGKTKLGISTYAILGWNFPINFEPLGQDIAKFGEIVDIVSPMAYPATFAEGHYYTPGKNPRSRMYYLVYRTLTGYKELLGENAHKLRPWIQGYSATVQNMKDQMDAVYDSGSCGFQVWNAGNNYAPVYEALKTTHRPVSCL